jgi:hypothetical protein
VNYPLQTPPVPHWGGDIVTYSAALDSYLGEIEQRCTDPAWLEWYKAMLGVPSPPPDALPPHPAKDDKDDWRKWWATYRDATTDPSLADGIFPDPTPQPDPAREQFRRDVAEIVREELDTAIPAVVAAVVEALRGQ